MEKNMSKQTNNIKMEKNNGFKKVYIKNRTRYYFDDIIEIAVFHFDNILLDKKSYENFLYFRRFVQNFD